MPSVTAPRTFELSDANGVSADTISRSNYGGDSHDSTDILDGNIIPLFLRHQHLALDETDAFDAVLLRLERDEPAGPPSDEFSQLLRLAVSQKNLRDSEDIAAWAAASAAVAAETGWAD